MDARNLRMARTCGVAARYLNEPDVICVNLRNLWTIITRSRLADSYESTPDQQNMPPVICVNLRNLRTIEKAGTMGPLITQFMDARNLWMARACGVAAR
jgi:hypothetical protein